MHGHSDPWATPRGANGIACWISGRHDLEPLGGWISRHRKGPRRQRSFIPRWGHPRDRPQHRAPDNAQVDPAQRKGDDERRRYCELYNGIE